MQPYHISPLAEEDIKDIARYTLKQWDEKQSMLYARKLEQHFLDIASEKVFSRRFSDHLSQVKVSHCEHHYVFHLH